MTEQKKQKTTAQKTTKAAGKVRPLVKQLYAEAARAAVEDKHIAYCMVGSNYDEILRTMEITPIWTENYGAVCAAKQAAYPFLAKAEADGFSNVLCSYAMVGLGHDAIRAETGAIPEGAPDGGMAKPTMLLGSSYSCDPRYKWYQALGRYLDAPIYCHDVIWPPSGWNPSPGEITDSINYQVEQLKGLVDFLESVTRKKLDLEKLSEIMDIADETYRIWYEAYRFRESSPCPMPSQDHFSCMVPAFYMIGDPRALIFYQELYDELADRIERGVGAIEDEKYRLMWGGGLPPWHTMNIFNYFERQGAVFTAETILSYRPPEPFETPNNLHPLERIAHRWIRKLTDVHLKAAKGCGDWRVQEILDLMDAYNNVGLVMHQARSCRAASLGQIHFRNVLKDHLEAPVLLWESDIVDVRNYSESQTKTRVDAFMETVENYAHNLK